MPLRDDGLYRGDGAFEVIRALRRPPVRARRPPRPAASARQPRSSSTFDRGALEAEIAALLAPRRARSTGSLRLIVTRGGAADRGDRADPGPRRVGPGRDRHLQPVGDPQRRQDALLRGEHDGHADRQARRRRRGPAGQAGRDRHGGADVDDLLGRRRGRAPHPEPGGRDPRLDHPRPDHAGRWSRSPRNTSYGYVLDASEVFLASSLREVQGVSSLDGLYLYLPGPRHPARGGIARRADRGRALPAP